MALTLITSNEPRSRKFNIPYLERYSNKKRIIRCTDKYVVDKDTKKVEKDHKKDKAITIVQDAASPKKSQEIVSKQKDNGCIELDDSVCDGDSVCNDLDAPKEEIITTSQEKITNDRLKSTKVISNRSYLKKAAPKHESLWKDKYNKDRDYLSKHCADNNVVENSTKKVIKDKKRNSIAKMQDSTTPEKCNETVSNQKDDRSFEISETVCKEIDIPVERVVTEVEKDHKKDKEITIVQDAASPDKCEEIVSKQKDEGEWSDKYNKAREYPSKPIGNKDAEEELIKCVDNKVTDKVIEEKKRDVIELKKDEIPKPEKAKSFFGSLYETVSSKIGDIGDQIEYALTFDKDKYDDYEKAEALIIVEESATPEKCKEIVSGQNDDGSIELGDTVCNELNAPKEEIITTIQKKITNDKLKLPELNSTAVNLSYLKKAAPKHESLWKDKYDKARDYLSKQIGDANAEKELLECADNYVIDHSIKKVIKDKKKNAVAKLQDSTTPEKCNDVISNQKDDGSFEVSETICKEIDIPIDVVPGVIHGCLNYSS
ncbi:hypothetical protein C2G38_2147276 [Gigaspora rosea]|uniref:Uncharacterized protein n=1 Tax=Gigaspora rosea TaxID=44941 RepID=A0A397UFR9_9GLOM|nr:hypothetical protein C2G38_2147276 [Gigaspora rosea]